MEEEDPMKAIHEAPRVKNDPRFDEDIPDWMIPDGLPPQVTQEPTE